MTIPFAQVSFPELYEQALAAPLFRPWAELTLDQIELHPGDRLLDVACGTGVVARQAQARLGGAGTVVGVDISAPMLAVARRMAPEIDWREADAAALPLRDGETFDVVVCQQGLQFFADRSAATLEMHRALVVGGRVAVGTWRPDDEIPFGRELRRVAERHLGPVNDRRHSFGETGPLEALLRDAGFRDVRSTTFSRTIRFADGSVFVRMNAMALVGMSERGKSMDEDERQHAVQAITLDSEGLRRQYTGADGLSFDILSNIAVGTK